MSEIITKGYLIARQDFETFDEIITFINEYGNKFTCLAKGVKKIESHNARHLNLGNFCEFQFFLARNEDKVSKLMKVTSIKRIEWPNYRQSLIVLNTLTEQLIYPNIKNYKFYESMLPYALDKSISDIKAELIILANYCELVGIGLHITDCVLCHQHHIKTISFKHHGLICGQCFNSINGIEDFPLEFSKLVYHLFKHEYDQMNQYEKHYDNLLIRLRQYIIDNNGSYFPKVKKPLLRS